jgi:light-harvesting complex 1 beta chain
MAASTLKSSPVVPAHTEVSRLVFWVGFTVFLVIALIAQGLAMRWRDWLPGAEGEKSLIDGVRAAVYSFMSNIP